jgi:hypothetical protein
MMKKLFSYLKNGEYKTKYEEKISQNNNIIYSAECALGKVVLYRKDGITYLKNLQIRQEYLPDNVIRFLEKYGTKEQAKVIISQAEYIQTGIELNQLRYQKQMAVDYVINHSVINREVIASMLGIPSFMLKKSEQNGRTV